jgi:hypothetical protein
MNPESQRLEYMFPAPSALLLLSMVFPAMRQVARMRCLNAKVAVISYPIMDIVKIAQNRKGTNMHTPGKYEACADQELAEILHNETLESWCVEECGTCQDMGWYGLLEHEGSWYICETDNDGFFTYETYETEEEARTIWQEIEDSYETYYDMEREN